jgi:hypothetical protein
VDVHYQLIVSFLKLLLMKKQAIKIEKGLSLDKEIIAKLNDLQMSTVAGKGAGETVKEQTCCPSCPMWSCTTSSDVEETN